MLSDPYRFALDPVAGGVPHMTQFLGASQLCCRRPALGICWSIDFLDPAAGYMGAGAHAGEPVSYHLANIDERTGLLLWDRTVDDWVGTALSAAAYLSPHSTDSWIADEITDATQRKIDRFAAFGSLAVDPSGAWCAVTNRRRLILTRDTLAEVWDGHPDVTGSSAEIRGFDRYAYFDNAQLHAGGLAWRIANDLYSGDIPPFPNHSGSGVGTANAYTAAAEGLTVRVNGELVKYWNNGGLPHLLRINGTTATTQQLFSVLTNGPPATYYYRSYLRGLAAMADGSLIAYQNNDPVRTTGDAVTGNHAWEFAKYNDAVIWATGTDILDGEGTVVRAGVEGGTWLGENAARDVVGVLGTESPTELILQTCDQSGETDYQLIDLPDEYPSSAWAHFGQTAVSTGSPRALTPVWSPRGNALLFLFRGRDDGAHKGELVASKYDLDAAEWRWFSALPNETGLPITAWSMAAKRT